MSSSDTVARSLLSEIGSAGHSKTHGYEQLVEKLASLQTELASLTLISVDKQLALDGTSDAKVTAELTEELHLLEGRIEKLKASVAQLKEIAALTAPTVTPMSIPAPSTPTVHHTTSSSNSSTSRQTHYKVPADLPLLEMRRHDFDLDDFFTLLEHKLVSHSIPVEEWPRMLLNRIPHHMSVMAGEYCAHFRIGRVAHTAATWDEVKAYFEQKFPQPVRVQQYLTKFNELRKTEKQSVTEYNQLYKHYAKKAGILLNTEQHAMNYLYSLDKELFDNTQNLIDIRETFQSMNGDARDPLTPSVVMSMAFQAELKAKTSRTHEAYQRGRSIKHGASDANLGSEQKRPDRPSPRHSPSGGRGSSGKYHDRHTGHFQHGQAMHKPFPTHGSRGIPSSSGGLLSKNAMSHTPPTTTTAPTYSHAQHQQPAAPAPAPRPAAPAPAAPQQPARPPGQPAHSYNTRFQLRQQQQYGSRPAGAPSNTARVSEIRLDPVHTSDRHSDNYTDDRSGLASVMEDPEVEVLQPDIEQLSISESAPSTVRMSLLRKCEDHVSLANTSDTALMESVAHSKDHLTVPPTALHVASVMTPKTPGPQHTTTAAEPTGVYLPRIYSTSDAADTRDRCPVEIELPSGKVARVMALLDSGADSTCINKLLVEEQAIPTRAVTGQLLAFDGSVRQRAAQTIPMRIMCGKHEAMYSFELIDSDNAVILGRDLINRWGMGHPNVPHAFPSQLQFEAIAYEGMTDKRTSVQDTPASAEDEKARAAHMHIIEAALARNAAAKEASGSAFISYPGSEVPIDHVEGTPPTYVHQYPIRADDQPFLNEQVRTWLATGKVEDEPNPENVRYNTPLIVAKHYKPSGEIDKRRVCGDLRGVNKGLIVRPFIVPPVREILDWCAGSYLFSELDLKQAYPQFLVRESDRHKLCFRWISRILRFVGAPFGLGNMTDHCQRVLAQMLADLDYARVFVDNVWIMIKAPLDYKIAAERVATVIDRLTKFNVWLNIERSVLMRTEMVALGHHVSSRGTRLDPGKVAAVQSWASPSTPEELARFLGFVNFLRPNIRHFSELTQPLNALRSLDKKNYCWTPDAEEAFVLLKHAVASAPLLIFPDLNKPMALAIDASIRGIGAVLYQPRADGDPPEPDTVVSFASRSLHPHERNYSVYKLEMLALVYALQYYDHYLHGREFTVLTDHRALMFLLEQPMNRVLSNWLSLILEYRFKVKHVPGYTNGAPDFLSRAYGPVWGAGPRGRDSSPMRGVLRIMSRLLRPTPMRQARAARSTATPSHASPAASLTAAPTDTLTHSPTSASVYELVRESVDESVSSPSAISHSEPSLLVEGPVAAGKTSAPTLLQRQTIIDVHEFGHFGVRATMGRWS